MISSLLESLGTFTILPFKKSALAADAAPNDQQKRRAWIIGFLPLVGIINGLIGAGLVWRLHADTSILVAWLVPVIWFFFTAANPFSSLCRASGALFAKSKTAAAELLSRENFTGLGMSVGLILLSGEFFALIQGSAVPRASLGTVVFLVPVFSRFTAVLFGCSTWGRSEDAGFGRHRFTAYALAAFLAVISSAASLELALLLFVSSLLTSTVLAAVVHSKAGTIPPSVLGAVVQLNEIVGLWIGVLYLLL